MGVKLAISLVPDEEDVRRLTTGEDIGHALPFKIYICFPRACPYFFKEDSFLQEVDEIHQEEPSDDTFTDYTPPSSQEEKEINQVQDMHRAEDLDAILTNVGVSLPMHDSCRCRIQFRPDSFDSNLLIPRWEISPDSCPDCTLAQQKFNQYVEETGIRVRLPENEGGEPDEAVNMQI